MVKRTYDNNKVTIKKSQKISSVNISPCWSSHTQNLVEKVCMPCTLAPNVNTFISKIVQIFVNTVEICKHWKSGHILMNGSWIQSTECRWNHFF